MTDSNLSGPKNPTPNPENIRRNINTTPETHPTSMPDNHSSTKIPQDMESQERIKDSETNSKEAQSSMPTSPDLPTEKYQTEPNVSPDIPNTAVTTINIGDEGTAKNNNYSDILKKGKIMLALIVGIIILIIIGAIAFISKRASSHTTKVTTITYWGLWDGPEVMQPLINKFEQTHPNIKVNYIQQDFGFTSDNYAYVGTYYSSVAERLTKTGGVDIMRVHVSWLPNIINFLTPAPQNIFPTKEVTDNYYKPVVDASVINDHIYDIPLYLDGLVMFYNPKLFQKAGIADIPSTWEDVLNDAPKLTIREDNHIVQSGVAIGTGTNIFHSPEILLMMLTQANVDVINLSNKQYNFATNEGLAALKYYTDFAKKYQVWSYTLPSDLRMFVECRLAMLFAPSFRAIDFIASNPKLDFAVKEPPVLPGARPEVPRYIGSYYTEVVPKNAPHPQQAWEFLHWLSQPEQLQKLYELQKQVHKTALPSPRKDVKQSANLSLTAATIHKMAPQMKVWMLYDIGTWEKLVREFLTRLESQNSDISLSEFQNLQQKLDQATFAQQ